MMNKYLNELFQVILNLSLIGSYVILLVLLARLLLRKAPRWCSYLLWGIVFLRLVCPVFPEMGFSLIPGGLETINVMGEGDAIATAGMQSREQLLENQALQGQALQNRKPQESHIQEYFPGEVQDSAGMQAQQTYEQIRQQQNIQNQSFLQQNAPKQQNLQGQQDTFIGTPTNNNIWFYAHLWLIVALLLAGYHISSYWKLKIKVKTAVMTEPGVREIQGEHLSFVMGIFKPIIYLSENLDVESRRVILCHERVHLQRKDYLTKPIALAICCLHWFNPLVWLAFYLMNKDCEMSCDEKVVSLLGEESKKIYSYALLDEATKGERKYNRKGSVCALLSFGENHVKKRVSHVLHYKKASLWVLVCAIIAVVVLVIGLCSNPGDSQGENLREENNEQNVTGTDLEGNEAANVTGNETENGAENDEGTQTGKTPETAQKSLQGAIKRYAQAFTERDGDVLYRLSYDKDNFKKWDMVIPLEDGSYAFGSSSPWPAPGDYRIDYVEGSDEATIRFIMSNSAPEKYVAEEKVKLTQEGDLYYVDHEEFKMYSEITDRQELEEIFDLEAAVPFDSISTGYSASFVSTILGHILNRTNPEYYAVYTDPVSSAREMLHLGAGSGEVTEQLAGVKPQNLLSSGYGEGTVVNVRYTFAKDGSVVDIPMVLADESENIWVLSTADLSRVDGSWTEIAEEALSGESVRKVYQEFDTYQVSSFGIYRMDVHGLTCIYPTYIPEGTPTAFYNGEIYFPMDSRYVEGASEWTGDSIGVLNPETEELNYLPLTEEMRRCFPLSQLYVRDGFICMMREGASSMHVFLLEDMEKVWEGKRAVELSEEEKEAFGIYNRSNILEHPNNIMLVGNHAPDRTFALIDMDGNGTTEEISTEPNSDVNFEYGIADQYVLRCGEWKEERYGDNMSNEILAFSPDGKRIFLALYEDGPSGDPLTTIFKYENGELQEAGEFGNDIRECSMENGTISTVVGNWAVQTDSIAVQYYMNENDELEMIFQESYEYSVAKYSDMDIQLKVDLPLYTAPGGEETFTIAPQRVRFLSVHNSWEWVLVEAENGQQGWMHVVDMSVVDLQMSTGEVFDGLNMAG